MIKLSLIPRTSCVETAVNWVCDLERRVLRRRVRTLRQKKAETVGSARESLAQASMLQSVQQLVDRMLGRHVVMHLRVAGIGGWKAVARSNDISQDIPALVVGTEERVWNGARSKSGLRVQWTQA